LPPRSGLERSDFVLWHIASFRRDVEFVRYRGKTDIDQAAPIELDLWVHTLEFSAQIRTEA
jgi:hypothetical protein